VLVNSGPKILSEIPGKLGEYAAAQLRGRGVDIRVSTKLASAEPHAVTLTDGTRLETDTLVWTAGVVPNPLVHELGLPLDDGGRIVVDSHLRVEGRENVWALGDCARVPNHATPERPDPPTCQHALRQARRLAKSLNGRTGCSRSSSGGTSPSSERSRVGRGSDHARSERVPGVGSSSMIGAALLHLVASAGAGTGAFAPADQAYLFEARQMQALSFAAHVPLVCFGIAFPALVLFVEWLHHRTGDPVYGVLARRWSKVMLALFAVGVVTGTILSFEMGLLWPSFMATFGEVFGLGFSVEGFSFFVEAIFIAIYVYGWDRLSPRAHLLCGIPIVVTGFAGSLMVIAVNGWMNHPTGFRLQNGRAVDVHPFAALFENRYFWHELVHMYLAGYIVAGFLTASVYAWGWLRGRRGRYERIALVVPLTVAALAAPAQIVVGDWAAREVAEQQPAKLAALEGLGETTTGAPVHVLGWYDGEEVKYGIKIPKLLSLLAFHDPGAKVEGLDAIPDDEEPPINVVRFAFQTMVGIGSALAALAALYIGVWLRRRRLPRSRWFYRAVVAAGPLSLVALIAGWVTTEVGRQPWVVYKVMRTEEAVTGASGIPVGYATLALVYAGLAVAVAWVLRRLSRAPLAIPEPARADAAR